MEKRNKIINELITLLKIAVVAFIVIYVMTAFVVRPIRVNGNSMYPTVSNNDIGFTNVISRIIGDIERFDVVIVFLPQQNEYLIKRVIGLPGETIHYQNNRLYVNGVFIPEPFLDQRFMNQYMTHNNRNFTADFAPVTVAEGQFFLIGDNRPNSMDSRSQGTYASEQIIGRRAIIVFPFRNMRIR